MSHTRIVGMLGRPRASVGGWPPTLLDLLLGPFAPLGLELLHNQGVGHLSDPTRRPKLTEQSFCWKRPPKITSPTSFVRDVPPKKRYVL